MLRPLHYTSRPIAAIYFLAIVGWFALSSTRALAQVGGDNVFEFLNFAPSARATALGGYALTIRDNDVALAYANPAALNPKMHQQLTFNHNIHLAGIGHGYVGYGHHLDNWATTVHAGIQYLEDRKSVV